MKSTSQTLKSGTIRSASMRAFRIQFKSQKISIRSKVMAKTQSDRSSQLSDRQDRRNLKFSNSAITFERIEIFWLLDQILKALIEADRMVPLLRVYDVVLNFRFLTKKNVPKKRTYIMGGKSVNVCQHVNDIREKKGQMLTRGKKVSNVDQHF